MDYRDYLKRNFNREEFLEEPCFACGGNDRVVEVSVVDNVGVTSERGICHSCRKERNFFFIGDLLENLKTPEEIASEIKKKVKGQDEAIKTISVAAYNHFQRVINSPYIIIPKDTKEYRKKALDFFDSCNDVYVKAASQGSSIGCYHVTDRDDLIDSLVEAFMYSSSVVIEKTIHHRELEVAVYELNGELRATTPGEVIIPENVFYTFDEKYSKSSSTVTTLEPDLPKTILDEIRSLAKEAFNMLSLRHLSRVDFFLTDDNKLIINEINTFPGMTSISLFPKLLQHNGDNMLEFLEYVIADAINENKK